MYRDFLIVRREAFGEDYIIYYIVPSSKKRVFFGYAYTRGEARRCVDEFWSSLDKCPFLERWLSPEELEELRWQRLETLWEK